MRQKKLLNQLAIFLVLVGLFVTLPTPILSSSLSATEQAETKLTDTKPGAAETSSLLPEPSAKTSPPAELEVKSETTSEEVTITKTEGGLTSASKTSQKPASAATTSKQDLPPAAKPRKTGSADTPSTSPFKSSQVWIKITAYKENDGLDLEDFNYDYDGTYVKNPGVKLDNGVYKIQTVLEEEDEYDRAIYEEGKTVSYRFFGFMRATSSPIYREGNRLYADLIIKEAKPAKESYNVRYMNKEREVSQQTLTVAYPVDDQGKTLREGEPKLDKSVGDTVNLGGTSYRIQKINFTDRTFIVQLEPVRFADVTLSISPNTTMKIPGSTSDSWTFEVNGKTYTVSPYAAGFKSPGTFSYTFPAVPIGESQSEADLTVKVSSLPQGWRSYFSITDQNYDRASKSLNIDLGRKLYIKVSNIVSGSTYENFGEKHNVPGFVLNLYDQQGHFLQKSRLESNYLGTMCMFSALKPGSYQLKVASAPAGYESYDMSHTYKLNIAPNGFPKLEIYQKNASYQLAKANGALDDTYPTDPLLNGIKTPLLLLLPKMNPPVKEAVIADTKGQEVEVAKDDVVTFNITKTICPDHNTALSFGSYINIGTKSDLGFEDVLDDRLIFQEGSLQVTVDGQPTTDFTASYDKQAHKIVVRDVSPIKVYEFDFKKPIQLEADKKLTVTFKVKVASAGGEILNTVGESTVRLVPFTISGKKIWQDDNDQHRNRPEFIIVKLLKNGVDYRTARVEPNPEGLWTYSFKDLPKTENGKEIDYTVAEVDVPGYSQSVSGTAKDGFVITNKLKKVNIEGKKTWQDDNNKTGKRPTSITVILEADGVQTASLNVTATDHWQWCFSDLPEFVNGKKVTYTIKELAVDGYESDVQGYDITNRKLPEPPPTTTTTTTPATTTTTTATTTTRPTTVPTTTLPSTGSRPTTRTTGTKPKPGCPTTTPNLPTGHLPKTGESRPTAFTITGVLTLAGLVLLLVKRIKKRAV